MRTPVTALDACAQATPDAVVVRIVEDAEGNFRDLTWAQAQDASLRAAAAFRGAGLRPGDRVMLSLPTSPELVAGILGAFRAGLQAAIVAPLAARRGTMAGDEQRALVEQLRPHLAVGLGEAADDVPALLPEALLATPPAEAAEFEGLSARASYVQFSSGSTGTPKGIVLGMPGIAANLEMMRHALPLPADDHICSWLPMYHDMGLFGTLLLAFWCEARITLMDPGLFVRNPPLWFRTIDRHRCTITATPPSALAAAIAMLRRRPPERLDLSTCTRYICGAEQVTPTLVEMFDAVLPQYGTPANALKPVYGLAEATLAVTMPPIGRAPVVVEHAASGANAWVLVGRPLDGLEVRLLDEDGATVEQDRVAGRLEVRGPCVHLGRIVDGVETPREGEWMDTGDLAFRVDGDYAICGRLRDIIILGGRNCSPDRIEELAMRVPGVLRCAALGMRDERRESERAVLVCELHPRAGGDPAARDGLRLALRGGLKAAGYEIDEVVFTARGALPVTTSGKIRRGLCRELLLAEALPPPGSARESA